MGSARSTGRGERGGALAVAAFALLMTVCSRGVDHPLSVKPTAERIGDAGADGTLDSAIEATLPDASPEAVDASDATVALEGSTAPDAAADAPPDPTAKNRLACTYVRGAMASATLGASPVIGATNPIEHIVVVMQENRSFDSYLSRLQDYEASLGITNAIESASPHASNPGYPQGQPGADDAGTSTEAGVAHHAPQLCAFDNAHSWAASHLAYDFGRNDGFYFASRAGVPGVSSAGIAPQYLSGDRVLAWYDESDLPFYYALYSTFAMADHYHSDVLGPTFPNRMYLYAATSFGVTANFFPDLDAYPYPGPQPAVIFDELQTNDIPWTIYAETSPAVGAVLGVNTPSRYPGNPVQSLAQFFTDAAAGTLPAVAFIDGDFTSVSVTTDDEHPPSDVAYGQHFVWSIVNAVTKSPSWSSLALFITYDEAGGFYDHVPPPPACLPDETPLVWADPPDEAQGGTFDRYGFRVPFVVVSPYAKSSYVSHVLYSHASLTRFIEAKEGLAALSARDANADALADLFDFTQPAFATPPIFAEPTIDTSASTRCAATLTACTDGGQPTCMR